MPTNFKQRAGEKLKDEFLRTAVKFTADRLRTRKADQTGVLGEWEAWREQGRAVRTHVVKNLDYYLDLFSRNMERRGGQVHFAADAAEASRMFLDIVEQSGAKLVAKSKSMVSEEIHINRQLEAVGVRCVETDLGEWIVQLAGETPSHIIIPAIHKNRAQIQQLFEEEGGETLSPETPVLAGYARRRLRDVFASADIGMTGCNFAIAETGSVVTFSNEGNGRMVSTLPRVQIVMMGMERILPSLDDLELMSNLLPRSATGQKMTTYISVLSGPRREAEVDGPEEVHVIVLDNGRSRQLGDPEFEEVLNCIRCGACLNVCPVYRQVGGHSYGGVYSGPIGAVITPLLDKDSKQAGELAYASSLCGACSEACPVKIPLHDMLVHLRRRYVDDGHGGAAEKIAMSGFAAAFGSEARYTASGKLGRWVQLNMAINSGRKVEGVALSLPGPSTAIYRNQAAKASASLAVVAARGRRTKVMERARFLETVAARLGRSHLQETPPPQPVRGVPEFYKAQPYGGAFSQMTPPERFKHELEAIGGRVLVAPDVASGANMLRSLLNDELAPQSIITWARSEFDGWPLDWLWSDFEAMPLTQTGVVDDTEIKRIAMSADVGVTLADFAVANTGTLAVSATAARPRSVSLTPTVHVALVLERQIVARMGAALEVYAGRPFGLMPSSLHFISGPSRSADIENDLSIGVHGPAALIVILCGGE